jgi:SMI1 / KNR4 family (SUKH-1)
MNPWERFQFKSAARRGCSPSLLAKFESLINMRLPDEYRTFLMEINGGRPTSKERPDSYAMVDVDWERREPQQTDDRAIVDYLFVVEDWSNVFEDDRSEALTLFGAYETFVIEQRALPYGIIPIGGDPGGSLFLLDVTEGRSGTILFWARGWYDPEQKQKDPYHNIGFIAPTFSEFLNTIRFEY